MKPIRPIKFIPQKCLYKILDILTHSDLVWQILDQYISSNQDRAKYLRELLLAVMLCGDIDNGYAVHKCEDCGLEHKVGFSCGKRFCNRCGFRRTENWVAQSKSKVLKVGHRHIIATIPQILWPIFAYERDLLKIIPQTGHQLIQLWGLEKGIVKHGLISIIHTFGYDIKWNPHGHFIVTEGGLTASNSWRSWPWNKKKYKQPYISFSFLQSKWRELFSKALFTALEERWDNNPDIRNYIYQEVVKIKADQRRLEQQKRKVERHYIGTRHQPSRRDLKDLQQYVKEQQWYVNAESRLSDGEHTIAYVGRYSNRPAMAECRIVNFDGETVTFWYDEKEKLAHYTKRNRKQTSLPIKVFITRILRHIPDKGCRMIEWFGLYASSVWHKVKTLLMKLGKYVVTQIKLLNYRESIKKYFGYDPLICKQCGGEMLLYSINYLTDGTMRTKRYLGLKGYIAKITNRIYNFNLNRFFKVDLLGQISIL
jgi:hypothetical protein